MLASALHTTCLVFFVININRILGDLPPVIMYWLQIPFCMNTLYYTVSQNLIECKIEVSTNQRICQHPKTNVTLDTKHTWFIVRRIFYSKFRYTYLERYGRMYLIECILIYKNVVRLDLFCNEYVCGCFMLGVIKMVVDFSCKFVLVVLSGKEQKNLFRQFMG